MAGHRDADDTSSAERHLSGAYLSVTMSRTAPSVELWLNVRAARPSVSSSTNLQPGATRLRACRGAACGGAAAQFLHSRRGSRAHDSF